MKYLTSLEKKIVGALIKQALDGQDLQQCFVTGEGGRTFSVNIFCFVLYLFIIEKCCAIFQQYITVPSV